MKPRAVPPVALPHGYTAEDLARGYTSTHGEQGREVRRAIPVEVLALIEARLLNRHLARLVALLRAAEGGPG